MANRNISDIAKDVIRYLRQGGTLANTSIKTMNSEMKSLWLELNKMVLAGETLSTLESFTRRSVVGIGETISNGVIGTAVGLNKTESNNIRKSIAKLASIKPSTVKTVNVSNAYVSRILKSPLQAQNYSMDDAFKAINVNLSRDTVNTLRRAFENGKSVDEISELFMASTKNIDMDKAARHLNTVVRTSIAKIANTTKIDMYEKNSDLIDRVLYVSKLDGRTSGFCQVHDGKVYDVLGDKPTLPAHFNCRSTYVPILIEDDEDDVKDNLNRLPGGYNSYEVWLSNQTVDKQKEILGVKAYNSFNRTGNLSKSLGIAVV